MRNATYDAIIELFRSLLDRVIVSTVQIDFTDVNGAGIHVAQRADQCRGKIVIEQQPH